MSKGISLAMPQATSKRCQSGICFPPFFLSWLLVSSFLFSFVWVFFFYTATSPCVVQMRRSLYRRHSLRISRKDWKQLMTPSIGDEINGLFFTTVIVLKWRRRAQPPCTLSQSRRQTGEQVRLVKTKSRVLYSQNQRAVFGSYVST